MTARASRYAAGLALTASLAGRITMDYTAFNVPVAIKAPAKSQVADGGKLKPGGGEGTNLPG
jgi:hypothetical protein